MSDTLPFGMLIEPACIEKALVPLSMYFGSFALLSLLITLDLMLFCKATVLYFSATSRTEIVHIANRKKPVSTF